MKSRTCVRTLLVATLLTGGAEASAQDLEVREVPLPIDSLLSSEVVIARVGPTVITVREFVLTSLFGPAFVKRAPDTRRRTLAYMINEKLLALGVRGRDTRVAANLEALEGDMATEELYRDDILKKVHIRESDIRTGVSLQRTDVALRWVFRKSQAEAAELARELNEGGSFDALFTREVADTAVRRDERTLNSNLFSIRLKNAPMAALAERLAVGRPSGPVEGPDGFYILQVDSVSRRPLMTETEEIQSRSDAWRALTKLMADSLSDVYIRRRMIEADPVIQRPVFDLLRGWLASREFAAEKFQTYGLPQNIEPVFDYHDIDRYAGKTLVALRGGKIPLGEFLVWYRLREANLRFRTESPKAFFLSIEDVVWRMVRDRLLVRTALKRGLQHRPSVVSEKRWWREKLLYQVAKDSIMRTIGWTDSTLHAYYDAHPRSFRDSTGAVRPFDSVKDDVLREWYDLELKKRTLHALAALKRTYPVSIDEKALKNIPVDAENNPRAIDVYTVKKGGTFPHPAFPAIDYSWQTWQ
jgi:hypothetical protein